MADRRKGSGAIFAMVVGAALSAAAPAAAPAVTVNGISRYCSACWRNARLPSDVWPDCTQEVLLRLLERLPPSAWTAALRPDGPGHRELLRAIDCVKKRVQRSRATAAYPDAGTPDPDNAIHQLELHEELDRAFASRLTPRQARILTLWSEGLDVSEIASRLGTTPPRVSDDKYKAINKLRDYFADRAV
jgi:RNA polymerase sigma factor (sigma-70 family)